MSQWRKFSRLPESPDYWRELRERISDAAQPLLIPNPRRDRWQNAALAAAVLATAAVIVLLLAQPTAAPADASVQASLAPADPVALDLLNRPQPPHISVLLPVYAPQQVP